MLILVKRVQPHTRHWPKWLELVSFSLAWSKGASLSPIDSLYSIWRICNLSLVLTQCSSPFSFFFFFNKDSYTYLYSPYSSRNFCKEYGTLCTGIYDALFWVQWNLCIMNGVCLLGRDHFVQNGCGKVSGDTSPTIVIAVRSSSSLLIDQWWARYLQKQHQQKQTQDKMKVFFYNNDSNCCLSMGYDITFQNYFYFIHFALLKQ